LKTRGHDPEALRAIFMPLAAPRGMGNSSENSPGVFSGIVNLTGIAAEWGSGVGR